MGWQQAGATSCPVSCPEQGRVNRRLVSLETKGEGESQELARSQRCSGDRSQAWGMTGLAVNEEGSFSGMGALGFRREKPFEPFDLVLQALILQARKARSSGCKQPLLPLALSQGDNGRSCFLNVADLHNSHQALGRIGSSSVSPARLRGEGEGVVN